MHHHRFSSQPEFAPVSTTAVAAPAAGAFLVCPMALCQGSVGPATPWLAAYQRAYECAQAVIQPSIVERLQRATLN
jgi:hypothetical protein